MYANLLKGEPLSACKMPFKRSLSTFTGAMAGRVQSDVKTALAFASLTQVGIITAEIGIGLPYVALIHIIGHACLRTLQLVRAPTLLHDYHMNGGPSHVDTFDPKPSLEKYAGKPLPMPNLATERKTGAAFPSPFKFQKYGESGIEVSELFAHTAQHIDDIAVIRSMHAEVPNHEPSLLLMNCGESRLVRPSMAAIVSRQPATDGEAHCGHCVPAVVRIDSQHGIDTQHSRRLHRGDD